MFFVPLIISNVRIDISEPDFLVFFVSIKLLGFCMYCSVYMLRELLYYVFSKYFLRFLGCCPYKFIEGLIYHSTPVNIDGNSRSFGFKQFGVFSLLV